MTTVRTGAKPVPLQEASAGLVADHVGIDPGDADRVEVLLGPLPEPRSRRLAHERQGAHRARRSRCVGRAVPAAVREAPRDHAPSSSATQNAA
jgi:hypothetical protein